MAVVIRSATLDGYDGIGAVFRALDAFYSEAVPHVFQPFDGPARTREYVASSIEIRTPSSWSPSRLATSSACSRYSGASLRSFCYEVKPRYVVIDMLGVRAAFRRRGIGRLPIERAHYRAAGKGPNQLELSVWEFNPDAIDFSEKLGYTRATCRLRNTLQ